MPSSARRSIFPPGAMPRTCAIHVLVKGGGLPEIADWVCQELPREKPEQDLHGIMREALKTAGITDQEIAAVTAMKFTCFHKAGHPNSAGRFVLGLSDQELEAAVSHDAAWVPEVDLGHLVYEGLIDFLFSAAPERLDVIAPAILEPKRLRLGTSTALLQKGGHRFEDLVVEAWRRCAKPGTRFLHSKLLVSHNPPRFRAEALALTRTDLASSSPREFRRDTPFLWLISTYGSEVLDDVRRYIEQSSDGSLQKCQVMSAAVKAMGREALPLALILVKNDNVNARKEALTHLIPLDDGTHGALIRSTLEQGIEETQKPGRAYRSGQLLIDFIKLAGKWQPAQLTEQLWELSDHKSKIVRDTAARALGRIGESIAQRAIPLLMEKKKERRGWAVTLLATIGSPSALKALDARLDDEPDDEVRDAMLLALDAARAASGGQVTRAQIGERVIRAAKKLQAPIAAWLDESRLPPLTYTDGEPLGPEATRFLLYRQSRAKEIRPDVEARPLYAMIDRKTGADFALELFRQFAATKADAADRWVLTVTGLLGDDRVVPTLNSMIQQWADSARGKMAEYGVQALALLGTDAALTMVDALAPPLSRQEQEHRSRRRGRLCRGRRTARDQHRRVGRPRRPLARV